MTGGALRLAVDGTIWGARGSLVAGPTQMPIAWHVDPWPLLRGELRVRLASGSGATDGAPRGVVTLADGRAALRDVDATIPVALVAAATRPDVARFLAGDIELAAPVLDWGPNAVSGDVRLRWRGARLLPSGGIAPLDLGDVSAALSPAGNRLVGPVSNVGGDVAIRGEVTLRPAETLAVSLTLVPRRPVDAALARMLADLGSSGADGWRVDWRLPLR